MTGGKHAALSRAVSGGQFGAALVAAGGQDRATRPGAHPQAEAVGLGPAAVVRLEGALAHEVSPLLPGVEGRGLACEWLKRWGMRARFGRHRKPGTDRGDAASW